MPLYGLTCSGCLFPGNAPCLLLQAKRCLQRSLPAPPHLPNPARVDSEIKETAFAASKFLDRLRATWMSNGGQRLGGKFLACAQPLWLRKRANTRFRCSQRQRRRCGAHTVYDMILPLPSMLAGCATAPARATEQHPLEPRASRQRNLPGGKQAAFAASKILDRLRATWIFIDEPRRGGKFLTRARPLTLPQASSGTGGGPFGWVPHQWATPRGQVPGLRAAAVAGQASEQKDIVDRGTERQRRRRQRAHSV